MECGIGYPKHQVLPEFGARSFQVTRDGASRILDDDVGIQSDSHNGGERSIASRPAAATDQLYCHLPIGVVLGECAHRFNASSRLGSLLQNTFDPSGRV